MATFIVDFGFCNKCGSVLPEMTAKGVITCYRCKKVFQPEEFIHHEDRYTIICNTIDKEVDIGKTDNKGKLVDRTCNKCGHDKMSYETLQLRSADEGQTVFYTCVKCNAKETENS